MKIEIKLNVGKKGIKTIFDDENNDLILEAHIKALIKALKAVQNKKYVNMKMLAYRAEKLI